MAAHEYHQEHVAPAKLNARLQQVQAVRYEADSTDGNAVYQSPHGWIEVVPSSQGYVIKYYQGCPC